MGVVLSEEHFRLLWRHFDPDGSGQIKHGAYGVRAGRGVLMLDHFLSFSLLFPTHILQLYLFYSIQIPVLSS